MIKNCTNQYAYSVEYIKQHCEAGGMFNESIIAGLSDGGIVNDSSSLALIIAAIISSLWAISAVIRFIWAFVDDQDFAWIDKECPALEFGLFLFFIPFVLLFVGTPVIVIFHYPVIWIPLSTLVFLMFVARYGRRTHKMLKEHMNDKKVHKTKEAKS